MVLIQKRVNDAINAFATEKTAMYINGIRRSHRSIGLQNFGALLKDRRIIPSLCFTLPYAAAMVVYVIMQKRIISGLTEGAVKG